MESTVNRRQWFAGIIATIAAILTPKPKLEAAPPLPTLDAARWPAGPTAQFYCYRDGGHLVYEVWPRPTCQTAYFVGSEGELYELGPGIELLGKPFTFDLPQFHKYALSLETPKLTDEQVDQAFDEVNRMLDRWAAEPLT